MIHAAKPAAPDATQRPPLASTAWVFDMLSEGTTCLSPEPGRSAAETGGQVVPTLILIGLLIVVAVLGYLL